MIRKLSLILLLLIGIATAASATNITMVNRSINLSNNINYIVSVEASATPMSTAQVTFNYDPTALQVNWVRQGNFLYYATNDAKLWNVWNDTPGTLMVVSTVLFDRSILQTKSSTLMTINMKPLRKGTTIVNLSAGVLINGLDLLSENIVSGMGNNYTIKVT
jgi:hypothetical protein